MQKDGDVYHLNITDEKKLDEIDDKAADIDCADLSAGAYE